MPCHEQFIFAPLFSPAHAPFFGTKKALAHKLLPQALLCLQTQTEKNKVHIFLSIYIVLGNGNKIILKQTKMMLTIQKRNTEKSSQEKWDSENK